MPEEAKRNIFKPFAGSAREGGTGLGLSIAQDIMRAHGGDIRLERSGSEGTLFRLVLPLRQAPAQPRSEEHTSELQSLMRISYGVFRFEKKTRIPPAEAHTLGYSCTLHIFSLYAPNY